MSKGYPIGERSPDQQESTGEPLWLTTDPDLIDWVRVLELLTDTSWGDDYGPGDVKLRQMNTRLHLAGFVIGELKDTLVCYLRVVTDDTTVAYLADVVVDPAFRGKGIGTMLVQTALDMKPRCDWLLHTVDAHAFYEKLGFERRGELLMERRRKRGHQS